MVDYINQLRTRGYTIEEAAVEGAVLIGVGTELIPADAIRLRKPDRVRELSHRFAGFVREGRERLHR